MAAPAKPSSLGDTRVVYCGGDLDRMLKLRDNSPALQGWVIGAPLARVPSGTKGGFCRPCRDFTHSGAADPALKRWAIVSDDLRPRCAEITRFFKQTKRLIIPLIVQEILDEPIAHKLA